MHRRRPGADAAASGCTRPSGVRASTSSLLGLLALAVGSMLRHSAGAITIDDRGGAGCRWSCAMFMLLVRVACSGSARRCSSTRSPTSSAIFYGWPRSATAAPAGWRPAGICSPGVTAVGVGRRLRRCWTSGTSEPSGRATPLTGHVATWSEPRRVTGPLHPRGAAVLRVPAGLVPVPAVVDARVLRPGDHVRDAGGDLLVAAGAAVRLPAALAPATCRTLHSSPCQLSADCQPP